MPDVNMWGKGLAVGQNFRGCCNENQKEREKKSLLRKLRQYSSYTRLDRTLILQVSFKIFGSVSH